MKRDIHPVYEPVVFRDVSVPEGTPGREFLTRSTAATSATATTVWSDGRTYPVVEVQISSVSHPFYTGRQKILDTAGRVEKFNRRYGRSGGAS
ncbi:type B 50S ribosomal protein L31 [Litorihabitans aurantiacus]|uniref:50S ribosomal protein L31 n=1 Tax=Litorihabitans aurantiacus TaxID=1930061 RepID=A0AA37XGM0_9MICO|nr:type B 50S ribosomal protein L31 [Litorihabitans aurantiacus]GMA33343.1 50S ribosomal protein L31 type B 2 [Litorihabitans aurantiacus]